MASLEAQSGADKHDALLQRGSVASTSLWLSVPPYTAPRFPNVARYPGDQRKKVEFTELSKDVKVCISRGVDLTDVELDFY